MEGMIDELRALLGDTVLLANTAISTRQGKKSICIVFFDNPPLQYALQLALQVQFGIAILGRHAIGYLNCNIQIAII